MENSLPRLSKRQGRKKPRLKSCQGVGQLCHPPVQVSNDWRRLIAGYVPPLANFLYLIALSVLLTLADQVLLLFSEIQKLRLFGLSPVKGSFGLLHEIYGSHMSEESSMVSNLL